MWLTLTMRDCIHGVGVRYKQKRPILLLLLLLQQLLLRLLLVLLGLRVHQHLLMLS